MSAPAKNLQLSVIADRIKHHREMRKIIHIPRLQQPVFDESGSGFTSRRLSPAGPERDIDWILITLPPNGKTTDIDSHRRGLEEYLYLLEGRLGANIDGQLVTLEMGDALFFEADTKYSFSNLGDAACRYLLIIDSAKVRAAGHGTQ